MPEEESDKTVAPFSSINFGLVIAFFLPGIVAFYALGYFSRPVATVFNSVLNKDQSVGASFLIIAGSLVVGLIVSSFRRVVIEWVHHHTGVGECIFDYGKFVDKDKKAALDDLIENDYRFYQFYGNIFVALFFLFMARLIKIDFFENLATFTINFLAMALLFYSSRRALNGMYTNYRKISEEFTTDTDKSMENSNTVSLIIIHTSKKP